MLELLASISQYHLAILVIVGTILCILGAVALIFRTSWAAVATIFFGFVFCAVPFLSQARLGKDGIEIVTIFQQASKDLIEANDKNSKAIEELRVGLASVQKLVAGLQLPERLSSTEGEAALRTFEADIERSIIAAERFVTASQAKTVSASEALSELSPTH